MTTLLQTLFFFISMTPMQENTGIQNNTDITGKWITEEKDKTAQIEIYLSKDGKYYGKVINNIKNPANNGRIMLKELVYNEKTKTYTGTMLPPDAGIELNVTITLESKDRLKIVARKLVMRKTMYLKRIS